MQSETAVNQHRIPVRMVKMNKSDHCCGQVKQHNHSGQQSAVPLLGICPQRSKNAGPVNITPKAYWFNIPEVSTKGYFCKTAIAPNLELCLKGREHPSTNHPTVPKESLNQATS